MIELTLAMAEAAVSEAMTRTPAMRVMGAEERRAAR